MVSQEVGYGLRKQNQGRDTLVRFDLKRRRLETLRNTLSLEKSYLDFWNDLLFVCSNTEEGSSIVIVEIDKDYAYQLLGAVKEIKNMIGCSLY